MSAGSLRMPRKAVRRGAVAVAVAGCAAALLVGTGTMQRAAAQTPVVDLAGATPYAVLASGTVTGSGTPSVTGDVGGSTLTGLDGRVAGAVHTGGGTAPTLAELGTADDTVASRPVTVGLTEVGGSLGPGTYGISGPMEVSGGLTLDAGGDGDATFVLKTDSTFTVDDGTSITLAGGARACNVFWLADDSATIGGTVVGTVFGRAGVIARSGATVTGRLLARSGAVRLDGATVRVPTDCDGAVPAGAPTNPGAAATPAPVPDGSSPGSDTGSGGSRSPGGVGGAPVRVTRDDSGSGGAGSDGPSRDDGPHRDGSARRADASPRHGAPGDDGDRRDDGAPRDDGALRNDGGSRGGAAGGGPADHPGASRPGRTGSPDTSRAGSIGAAPEAAGLPDANRGSGVAGRAVVVVPILGEHATP